MVLFGIRKLLNWVSEWYYNLILYVIENGRVEFNKEDFMFIED